MIRYARYLLLIIVAVALVTVSLANRAPVPLRLLPEDVGLFLGLNGVIELPLFLVMFGGMVVGIMLGFVWEWMREHKHRKTANRSTREVARLERELAVMRDSTSLPQDDVLALIEKPKKAS
jgi:lipopolysaccharide assembly protein A